MDKSHDDQNFRCKIVKIWSKTYVFCCKKYPIFPISVLILFSLLYLFFPLAFKFSIFSFPLVGILLIVYGVLSGRNRKKIKRVGEDEWRRKIQQIEEDDRRRRFAKSRRSFKSVYSDRNQLIRRNAQNKNGDFVETNVEKKDDILVKSLNEVLGEIKPKDLRDLKLESNLGKGKYSYSCSSPRRNVRCNSDNDEDDQKNMMDLGLLEAERNKRLESLMERRRSRKNLGFEEIESKKPNKNVEIPAIKTTKMNPFFEDNSSGMKSPGSAPSFMLTSNPFDLPYDPNEEKPDLSGDNFHEEFAVGHPKEPVFCRHESFSLGAFSRPVIKHDNHEISSNKRASVAGFGTSTNDSVGEEDGTEMKACEIAERKADINFFYGNNKKVYHASSNSMVSDMQVEVSDEDTVSNLDDLDIEKDRESLLNLQGDLEAIKEDGEKDDTNWM